MRTNDRLQALQILTQLLQKKVPLSHLLKTSPTPSAFTKELCFGLSRHYFRLESIAKIMVTKQPKPIEVWICILLGLYQLSYTHTQDYAAVQETVALLTKIKADWAKGFVNAILRRYCREKEKLHQSLNHDPMFCYGLPTWMLKKIKLSYPDHWESIALAFDKHPPMSLRVNTLKTTRENYYQLLLQNEQRSTLLPHAKEGIRLEQPIEVNQLPCFDKGFVSLQDEAAQLAESLLNIQPGYKILDACCAPGGKLCHILEKHQDLEQCIAIDKDKERVKKVSDNLKRLGLNTTVLTADALSPDDWWDGQYFDRILLDAPCSATGIIRRHPDIKLLRTPEEIQAIVQLQQQLLKSLWRLLTPGGMLVYSTCSIMPEENVKQIQQFLKDTPDCSCLPFDSDWGQHTEYGVQILPGEHDMDGFFYSLLKKNDE